MPFFNIFSKNKENNKEKPKIKVIIDNREKNSLVASKLASIGFEIEFQQLPVADYLINDIAIERKTISDLKSSIINKRIFSQLSELRQYKKPLLIIEGGRHKLYDNIVLHENAIRGFLLSVAVNSQIPVIFTENEKDTAKHLSLLANKKQNKEFSLRAKISLSEKEQAQFILEGFPGIGPKTAKKLLNSFSSLENIFNASEKQLSEIIGSKTSEFIRIIKLRH